MNQHRPGWYPDPSNPGLQRYWDGTNWTQHTAPTMPQVAPPAPTRSSVSSGTNGLAIASFILALLWLCGVGAVLGVIFGHIALSQIRKDGQKGRGLAVAGTVLGYLGIAGIVLFAVAANNAEPKERAGVIAGVPTSSSSDSDGTTNSSAAPSDDVVPGGSKPLAVAGFTKHEALGETWVSVGLVMTGLTGGSQELTITLLDAAGTPLATNTEFVGSDRGGGEVLVASLFTENTPTVASVRVDVTNASSFIDATPFPVSVLSQGFDGNFWTVKGTATNDSSENIDYGTITCVAFKGGVPVAGGETGTATMVPGAPIAFDLTETFDPQADEVRCQGEAS